MPSLNLYTIPPEKPFVDVLAAWVLERFGKDPLALAQAVILVPSRRAQRSLQEAFLRASDGKPLLLPRLRPIGDVDEDELLLSSMLPAEALEALPPVMPGLTRCLHLTRLIWAEYTSKQNVEQAARLAVDLASFLDEVIREQCDMNNLGSLVPEDYSEHWQVTLNFLEILTRHWPQLLNLLETEDTVSHRNRLLKLLAEEWQAHPPNVPIIVAGITGSIPAAIDLIKVVSSLPQGHIVLPGLDLHMDEASWDIISDSHPQWGLRALLQHLGVSRQDVALCDDPRIPGAAQERSMLLSYAMLPAEHTEQWTALPIDAISAMRGLRRIDCATLQEEAQVIALLMRETLESPGQTAALVTQDRSLGRRVASAMQRFGVTVDDSAGTPLTHRPEGVYMQLVAEVCASHMAPVPLLALLKHPLASGGMAIAAFRDAARELEEKVLRGVRPAPGLAGLRAAVASNTKVSRHVHLLMDTLDTMLKPLEVLFSQRELSLKTLLEAHLEAMESLAHSDEQTGEERLWLPDAGEQLSEFLQELMESAEILGNIDPISYPGLLSTLLSGEQYRPRYAQHPRLHILGPLEARLQHYDRVILGGMNESSWPPQITADPWMSRPMRETFGLPSPERRIGLSAHDFTTLACAQDVIFTRAQKVDGTPTIPSRWLTRLDAVLEAAAQPAVMASYRETQFAHWARAMDAPAFVQPMQPPEPKPPVSARPRSLAVTSIEKLMRDPYSIYAQKILQLKKLDPLDQEPGAADFGTFVHGALELFVKKYPGQLPGDALEPLLECGREVFSAYNDRPAVATFWWPRFEGVAHWIIEEEAQSRPHITQAWAELTRSLKIELPAGLFEITAKMDRVEQNHDGTLNIIDYKTGGAPDKKDILSGLACQLPLEALILETSDQQPTGITVALEYWGVVAEKRTNLHDGKTSLQDIIDNTRDGVQNLLAAFDNPATPYRAVPTPENAPRYSDYEHLERIKEWGGA